MRSQNQSNECGSPWNGYKTLELNGEESCGSKVLDLVQRKVREIFLEEFHETLVN